MVNKQKILIVDDDANIAELISLYLTKECFDTMIYSPLMPAGMGGVLLSAHTIIM